MQTDPEPSTRRIARKRARRQKQPDEFLSLWPNLYIFHFLRGRILTAIRLSQSVAAGISARPDESNFGLALMADAFGEGSGPLARDVHKFRIRGNLIQHRKDALRFRQQAAIEVGFELQKRVVDSQPVVAHAAQDQVHVFLLPRKPLENLQKLGGGRIQRVVEFGFVDFGSGFPAESLLAKVSDFPVYIQILTLKMFQLRCKIEHLRAQRRAHLERRSARIFVELADFIRGGIRILLHGDLTEFRRAGFEDAAKSQLRASGSGRRVGRAGRHASQSEQQSDSQKRNFHRVDRIRGSLFRVAPPVRLAVVLPGAPAPATKARGRTTAAASGKPNRIFTCSACKWHNATASASAASAGSGVSVMDSSALTIICICRLSACPLPVTDAFTS